MKILKLSERNFGTILIKMFKIMRKINKIIKIFTKDKVSKNKADEYFCNKKYNFGTK